MHAKCDGLSVSEVIGPLPKIAPKKHIARPIDNNGHLLGLATGESLAHINYLLARGEAVCETGADGVRRYRMK